MNLMFILKLALAFVEVNLLLVKKRHACTLLESVKVKKPRLTYPRGDYLNSAWWLFLQKDTIKNPFHRDGKLFRTRFRVPYDVFMYIVNLCKVEMKEDLNTESKDIFGRYIPIELKVLGVLRVLARGCTFDCIAELTNSNKEAHRLFFHKFNKIFIKHFYETYINYPTTDEEVYSITKIYKLLGFPGCVGSIDVVHIGWELCPKRLTNVCTGKSGYPTLAYEVAVDHRKRILHTTPGHFGTRNDKTIVKFDSLVSKIRYEEPFSNFQYEIFQVAGDGNIITHIVNGVYLICDNGYHSWKALMCPLTHCYLYSQLRWSKWLESTRKDVECCFGILKKRFAILKYGYRFHLKQHCDNTFAVCCMLHNLLLIADGYNTRWEDLFEEENENMQHDDQIIKLMRRVEEAHPRVNPNIDLSTIGINEFQYNIQVELADYNIHKEIDPDFRTFRELLIFHFDYMFTNNRLQWPR